MIAFEATPLIKPPALRVVSDFARREMVSSFFVGLFIETSHEVFKHVTHRNVRNRVRVQINGGDFFDDLKQPIGFFQLFNLFIECDFFDDLPRPR